MYGAPPHPRADRFMLRNPASSDPLTIYWRFYRDIADGDEHSTQIETNRDGLLRGAAAKRKERTIDLPIHQHIKRTVRRAPLRDFSPLLLVIPYTAVSGIVKPVAVSAAARATSEEYVIEHLPGSCFDVLELHR